MRGSVEIYKAYGSPSEELLYKENNLLVDGAGSLVVDMLTTSPSLSAINSAASLLDTSNFTVQAISFGKAASGYTQNAHRFLDTGKNILNYTEAPDFSGTGGWQRSGLGSLTVTPDATPGPYGGTSAAELFVDQGPTDSENASFEKRITKASMGLVSGTTLTASIFMKAAPGTTEGQLTILKLQHMLLADTAQVQRNSCLIQWKGGVPRLYQKVTETPNTNQDCIYLEKIGNDGWYRIGTTRSQVTTEDFDLIHFSVFPAGYVSPANSPDANTQGSLYVWGAQLEVGGHMTSYQPNLGAASGTATKNAFLATSGGNPNHGATGGSAIDITRAVGFAGVSSYAPEGALPAAPVPMDKVLELDTRTAAEIEAGLDHSVGHNLNTAAYRWGVSSNFVDVSSHNKAGKDQGEWAYTEHPFVSSLGYYMGCYPEGSSVGGTSGALVTDSKAAFASDATTNMIASAVYNGHFNEVSSMDVSGFVGAVYEAGLGNTVGRVALPLDGTTDDAAASGLAVSSNTTFSAQGSTAVEYRITLASGDLGYSNLYGGIYTMGLWGIDNKETMLAGNTPPYSFDALNNPRKYKLFAKKSFTDNLAKTDDIQMASPIGGLINQQDLTIIWRIDF